MSNCPQCKRPYNTGNSPNRYECHDFDDGEDSVCYAYSGVAKHKEALKKSKDALSGKGA
jgi:hypothetical protein